MINLIGELPARDALLAPAGPALARLRQERPPGPQAGPHHPGRNDGPAARFAGLQGVGTHRSRDLARNSVTPLRVSTTRGRFFRNIGRSDVHRELQTQGTAVPAQPGSAVPVPVARPCARQGVHGIDHLVHGWLRGDHRRNRRRQDHAHRKLPASARFGRGHRADQPDPGHARSNSCSRCSSSSASRPSR